MTATSKRYRMLAQSIAHLLSQYEHTAVEELAVFARATNAALLSDEPLPEPSPSLINRVFRLAFDRARIEQANDDSFAAFHESEVRESAATTDGSETADMLRAVAFFGGVDRSARRRDGPVINTADSAGLSS